MIALELADDISGKGIFRVGHSVTSYHRSVLDEVIATLRLQHEYIEELKSNGHKLVLLLNDSGIKLQEAKSKIEELKADVRYWKSDVRGWVKEAT